MNEAEAADRPRVMSRLALDELYAQHAAPLQRLAYLMTSDHHLSEDITQQAFIRFYGRFGNLRDPSAAPAYLKRTVVNLARGHHRRARLERLHLKRRSRDESVSRQPSVEDHDQVIAALRTLPHRQRAALVLRFYDDLSEDQAAAVMDCSRAAMKSLTARAMASLRAVMEGAGHDD